MPAHLSETTRGIETLDGRAEAIPLPDCSADAVAAGQAFHWFRTEDALIEMHRVLRPGGRPVLIWNVRATEQPLQASLDATVSPHERHTPAHQWQVALASTPLFTARRKRQFRCEADWDAERFVAFTCSLSELAALPGRQREAAPTAVRKLTTVLPPALQGGVPHRRLRLHKKLTTSHAAGHHDRLGLGLAGVRSDFGLALRADSHGVALAPSRDVVPEERSAVVSGGRDEVMAAAARGAKSAGGTTIGILPVETRDDANEWIDHAVVTGMGHGRNLAVAASGDAAIAVGG